MSLWGWCGNSGNLAIFLAMGSFFLLPYRIKKVPALFLLALILILLTKSTTAILSVMVGSIFYFNNKGIMLASLIILSLFIGFVKPIRPNHMDIYTQAIKRINPIGYGLGVVPELKITDKGTPVMNVHSEPLEVGVDLGWIGLILFAIFIAERLYFFINQNSNDLQLRMIASLISYLVSSLFWFPMHLAQLSFYAILIWSCLEYSYQTEDL